MANASGRREWCVPGLVPPGLTLFAGQPKLGKTTFALDLAWNVASGNDALGNVLTHQGDVLFVAAETGASELKDRADETWPDEAWPSALSVIPMDVLKDLGVQPLYPVFEEWYVNATRPALLVMDTFSALIGLRQAEDRGRPQTADYRALRPYMQWAAQRNVSILVLHHTNQRRLEAGEDWMNSIAGTNGLVGAADTVMLLSRHREEGLSLRAKGRYLPESEWTVVTKGRRHILYDPVATTERLGDRMKHILDVIASNGGEAETSAIIEQSGLHPSTVKSYLHRLVQRDVLVRLERGWYRLTGI
jgi:predicted ATP-dependent serine protease/predicted transcriptional regulator